MTVISYMMDFKWTREPAEYSITDEKITITTAPHTDLWQRTYYHFRNDNAPGKLPMRKKEPMVSVMTQSLYQRTGMGKQLPACRSHLKKHIHIEQKLSKSYWLILMRCNSLQPCL